MRFYFPDSQDFVDPSFDFHTEERNEMRIRQRDDLYAHELGSSVRPYDGLLISRAIVEGFEFSSKSRYSEMQKNRLFREKAHSFFRLNHEYSVMGDCGAFAYVDEDTPPYSVESLIDFYVNAGVDSGISLDHIVFEYCHDVSTKSLSSRQLDFDKIQTRIDITLENSHKLKKYSNEFEFTPYGVAHGWNPISYANSIIALQQMGYKKITIGGLIPLKTEHLLDLLKFLKDKIKKPVEYHLLGIGRLNDVHLLKKYNVGSLDSTTPLKKSFMNAKNNYELNGKNYCAIKVSQTAGNNKIKTLIHSGKRSWEIMIKKEQIALQSLRDFDSGKASLDATLNAVLSYEYLCSNRGELMKNDYLRTLREKPWKKCGCVVCNDIGIDVIIFRGAERNKRRGFHNLFQNYKKIGSL
ncbi:tRNA-guanine transglycosylase DpdA [Aliivibrio fischeri]|uniref:tRNA-guanine transglycosylase DpdA n=1 Tax=Aliivibrio fischeri TaxID=668 RepID=UPI0007C5B9C2|nr:tRNA-guanine transglycosylase DpdA [Aliivibrio fischeri]